MPITAGQVNFLLKKCFALSGSLNDDEEVLK